MHDGAEPDIGSWVKTTKVDDERMFKFVKEEICNKKALEFGRGTGSFLNLAKAYANEFSRIELEKALEPFFKEKDLNVFLSLEAANKA